MELRERIRAHAHAGVVKWAGLGQRAMGETLVGRQCPLKGCFRPKTMQLTSWPKKKKKKNLAQHMLHISILKIFQVTTGGGFLHSQRESKPVLKHHRVHGSSKVCSKVRQMIPNAVELISTSET